MNLEKTVIGIEFGSTRIKAVMLDEENKPVASGSYDWENRFEGGYWTYSQEEIFKGIQDCYKELKKDVKEKFGLTLTTTGAIGISGMMHGYLVFDKEGNQLEEFRTWRNTTTGEAAEKLSENENVVNAFHELQKLHEHRLPRHQHEGGQGHHRRDPLHRLRRMRSALQI